MKNEKFNLMKENDDLLVNNTRIEENFEKLKKKLNS